jgi:hypothetical protein
MTMNEWDIMRELITVRQSISRIETALEGYGMPDQRDELRAVASRVLAVERLVSKHFERPADDAR